MFCLTQSIPVLEINYAVILVESLRTEQEKATQKRTGGGRREEGVWTITQRALRGRLSDSHASQQRGREFNIS